MGQVLLLLCVPRPSTPPASVLTASNQSVNTTSSTVSTPMMIQASTMPLFASPSVLKLRPGEVSGLGKSVACGHSVGQSSKEFYFF